MRVKRSRSASNWINELCNPNLSQERDLVSRDRSGGADSMQSVIEAVHWHRRDCSGNPGGEDKMITEKRVLLEKLRGRRKAGRRSWMPKARSD